MKNAYIEPFTLCYKYNMVGRPPSHSRVCLITDHTLRYPSHFHHSHTLQLCCLCLLPLPHHTTTPTPKSPTSPPPYYYPNTHLPYTLQYVFVSSPATHYGHHSHSHPQPHTMIRSSLLPLSQHTPPSLSHPSHSLMNGCKAVNPQKTILYDFR